MLKNILNLNGAQELSKNEQKTLLGGDLTASCQSYYGCLGQCINGTCSQYPHPIYPGVRCYECIPGGGGNK